MSNWCSQLVDQNLNLGNNERLLQEKVEVLSFKVAKQTEELEKNKDRYEIAVKDLRNLLEDERRGGMKGGEK